MLKSCIKIALRNMLRHKSFTFINIAGLTVGLACCALILLYIWDEVSYDRFHHNAANIYRLLLTGGFTRLVVLAFLISIPIVWLSMQKWLQNFAYRTEIEWWVFLLAGGLELAISLLTVSWQAVRAATANPIESLRYE